MFAVMPDDVLAKDHVATTAGFVIGERGVLVVESMLNGDLASQLIGLCRQATTKPIRFLVNTSYHGDHAYGNYLFPETAVVIQHPATKSYMDEHFEEDRRFMIGLMGQGKGIERVQRAPPTSPSPRCSVSILAAAPSRCATSGLRRRRATSSCGCPMPGFFGSAT